MEVPLGAALLEEIFINTSIPPSTLLRDIDVSYFESLSTSFGKDTSPLPLPDVHHALNHRPWESLPHIKDKFDQTVLHSTTEPQSEAIVPLQPLVATPSTSLEPYPQCSKRSKKSSAIAGSKSPVPSSGKWDSIELKRARNTESARKSRARKRERQEEMGRRIVELEKLLGETQKRELYWKFIAESRGSPYMNTLHHL
ncbi:hypothetical protein EYZ11_012359 [Aspergillus tanneri]|uniref:BZIP domain-containing protein n=1 Tax=Aspergillus tanneri TaxID=1220188 RepID=A0A4S3J0G1_9EURO|nr:uncharacterized protein ATNIH1004_011658 [Aspergillus tanneri]KAA8641522.1 hypothetical protein ATNIH1004_011658 [Aspergillus tanneri]THC88193.1 hypothetical protein EYZ11_012359 [Aspergillus tanneri]